MFWQLFGISKRRGASIPALRNRRVPARHFERLESRRLLATVSGQLSVSGVVFVDTNLNGVMDTGEGVDGALLELVQIGPDSGQAVASVTSDASGNYSFDVGQILCDLPTVGDAAIEGIAEEQFLARDFFVRQVEVPSGATLRESRPFTLGNVIDDFSSTQDVRDEPDMPDVDDTGPNRLADAQIATISRGPAGANAEYRTLSAKWEAGGGSDPVSININPFPGIARRESASIISGASLATQSISWSPIPQRNVGLASLDLAALGANPGFLLNTQSDFARNAVFTLGDVSGSDQEFSQAFSATSGAAELAFVPIPAGVPATLYDALTFEVDKQLLGDIEVGFIAAVGSQTGVDFLIPPPTSDLFIGKAGPDEVIAGTAIQYELTVMNRGPDPVANARVIDSLPALLVGSAVWSCELPPASAASCSASVGDGNVDTFVNLGVGESLVIRIDATVPADASGSVTNLAWIEPPDGTVDPDYNLSTPADTSSSNADALVTQLIPQFNLAVSKSFVPSSPGALVQAIAGERVNFQVTVSHESGPSDGSTTVSDLLSTSSLLTDIIWSCTATGGAICAAGGSGDLQEAVVLPVGSSAVFDISALVLPSARGIIYNVASITSGDSNSNDDTSAPVEVPIVAQADLAITKTVSVPGNPQVNNAVVAGLPIEYQIGIHNPGPSDLVGVQLFDQLSSELTSVGWACFSNASCPEVLPEGDLNATYDIPAGTEWSLVVSAVVRPTARGTIANAVTATLPQDVVDPGFNPNAATVESQVLVQADINVSKSLVRDGNEADDVPIVPGSQVVYNLLVSNPGPSSVTVRTTDTLPTELSEPEWCRRTSASNDCVALPGVVNLNDEVVLGVGESLIYEVLATLSPPTLIGVLTNTADVTVVDGVGNGRSIVSHRYQPPTLVSGVVFNDSNQNSQQDDTELGLQRTVCFSRLVAPDSCDLGVYETGPDGHFAIDDLPPTQVQVSVLLPRLWAQTSPAGQFELQSSMPSLSSSNSSSDIAVSNFVNGDDPAINDQFVLLREFGSIDSGRDESREDLMDRWYTGSAELFGEANETLRSGEAFEAGRRPRSIVPFNYDDDPYMDLAVASIGTGQGDDRGGIGVFRNLGDGTFEFATAVVHAFDGPIDMLAIERNADRFDDLIVVNFRSGLVSVVVSDGLGGFEVEQEFAAGSQPISIAEIGDIGSATQQFAIADFRGHGVTSVRLLDEGNAAVARIDLPGAPTAISSGSLLTHGEEQVIVAVSQPNTSIMVVDLEQQQVTTLASFSEDLRIKALTIADVNSDSLPDILAVSGTSSDLVTLKNLGDGSFVKEDLGLAGVSASSAVAVGHFNDDGNLDIVAAHSPISSDVSSNFGASVWLHQAGKLVFDLATEPIQVELDFGQVNIRGGTPNSQASSAAGESTMPAGTRDMNGDGILSALDVLLVVNFLNEPQRPSSSPSGFDFDVNEDGLISALDVLVLIDELNRLARNDQTNS